MGTINAGTRPLYGTLSPALRVRCLQKVLYLNMHDKLLMIIVFL